ncbi:MAG: hypothetical protein AB8G16_09650 [Gammaproteobacteria bacterium]
MLRAGECWQRLEDLLAQFSLELHPVVADSEIPGSHWGAPEAGLKANRVYARADTPVHSVLHESGHAICMSATRRSHLDTDAGGDDHEENAVCYLQILLAREFYADSLKSVCADMDDWGYTFRLGSAQAWFLRDAHDARAWLHRYGLIGADDQPTYQLRA